MMRYDLAATIAPMRRRLVRSSSRDRARSAGLPAVRPGSRRSSLFLAGVLLAAPGPLDARPPGWPTVDHARGWAEVELGPRQWPCLDRLVERESRWRVDATNRRSGAYGLPQALPGSKMARAGSDWRTNPITQLRWMIGYVRARYGSACAALRHSLARGWY